MAEVLEGLDDGRLDVEAPVDGVDAHRGVAVFRSPVAKLDAAEVLSYSTKRCASHVTRPPERGRSAFPLPSTSDSDQLSLVELLG